MWSEEGVVQCLLVSGGNLSHRPGEISGDQRRPAETNKEEEVLSSPFKSLRILSGPSRAPRIRSVWKERREWRD